MNTYFPDQIFFLEGYDLPATEKDLKERGVNPYTECIECWELSHVSRHNVACYKHWRFTRSYMCGYVEYRKFFRNSIDNLIFEVNED